MGEGQFSIVYLCEKRLDGCRYAIKKNKVPIRSRSDQRKRLAEVFAAASLSHLDINNKHIIKYYTCWQEEHTLYIQYEACEYGNITSLMKEYNNKLPEKIIIELLLQVCDALNVLHKNNYVHLDIKPDNILIYKKGDNNGKDWLFKICDFGLMSRSDGSMNYNEGDSRYCSLYNYIYYNIIEK